MFEVLSILFVVFGLLSVLLTVGGTLELCVLSLGFLIPRGSFRNTAERGNQIDRLAVVIPAHNEEQSVARCVRSIKACSWNEKCDVFVVADNCSDETEVRAREAGAQVLVHRSS